MKENRETRERLATLERRKQEKEQAAAAAGGKRKKGSFKFFSRSSKNMEEEMKREFEAKSRGRKIDVKALEDSRKDKSRQDREQKDFRHLLRRTGQPQPQPQEPGRARREGGSVVKRRSDEQISPREQKDSRNVLRKTDQFREQRSGKRQSGGDSKRQSEGDLKRQSGGDGKRRSGGDGKDEKRDEQPVIKTQQPSRSSRKGKKVERQGSELTGSWDFIPSPPTSTVDLIGHDRGEPEDDTPLAPPSPSHFQVPVEHHYIHHQGSADGYGAGGGEEGSEEESGSEEDYEMDASLPMFNLSSASNAGQGARLREDNASGGGSGFLGTAPQQAWSKSSHQDFDFETQF